jgi:NTP pyrophosphatase (non-canonical NTP hydrolase)
LPWERGDDVIRCAICGRPYAFVSGEPITVTPAVEAEPPTVRSFEFYQREAERVFQPEMDTRLVLFTLGLAGETGEAVEVVKKHLRDHVPLDREHLLEELGDVLYCVLAVAHECGATLADVASRNIEKMRKRFPNGFEPGRR